MVAVGVGVVARGGAGEDHFRITDFKVWVKLLAVSDR